MPDDAIQPWLESFLSTFAASAGTVHIERDGDLHLAAEWHIPPPVLEKVRFVKRGKGMAGTAQIRGIPTQTCNLVEDTSGDINPTARLVGAKAAIALPVHDGTHVRAVVGAAFDFTGEIPADTVTAMQTAVGTLPR